jgi:putative nucleotidyltransferase with HDIG domain
MQTIAGMVTIFSVTNLRKRAQFFVSAGMIFLSYMFCYVALSVIHEGTVAAVDENNLFWLIGNVLLTLFSYPLIYIFEKLFGLTSDVSLMELADTNAPLLRELSIKAPGTFQHSMQVANLAEAAIFKIGGNSLLIRVGALYHDIGKMDMPLYFIENQTTGINPHDELSFEESAAIIISHVIRGIEKARKNKIPDLIIDFIRTHHGTTMVQYFYQSYLKNYPEEIIDEEDFRYPGPLPFSKETAVLMMADSVEAASRSLAQPSQEAINKIVDVIIDSQIDQHQFINCNITFRDISSIKKIFKKMLMSIYHVRVEYPRG